MKKTKKDNTEKTVEEFEREAKARIAARKGKGPKLAQTYDELILASIAVIDAYEKSRPFYKNGTHVDPKTLVFQTLNKSFALDRPKDSLRLMKEIADTPQKELAETPPTKEQHRALVDTVRQFISIICEIAHENPNRYLKYLPTTLWMVSEDECYTPRLKFYFLLSIAAFANLCEIDIALEHYASWEKEWKGCIFDVFFCGVKNKRKTLEDMAKAVREMSLVKFMDFDVLAKLEPSNFPRAFIGGGVDVDCPMDIRDSIRKALLLLHDCGISGNKHVIWWPTEAIREVAYNFDNELLNYFRRERNNCNPTSNAHRKWLEAEAELTLSFSDRDKAFTPERADRIIALADDAAREQWIEARMTKNTKALDEETDKTLFQTPPTVRLADDQMAQITKVRSHTMKKLNVIDRKVSGEYTKKNEKTPERQRSVDCAKKHYYRILDEGIVKPHNAITAACHAADKEMNTTFGTYKTEGCFTEALRRVIDARNAHYGAKAAHVNLPNPK